MQQVFIIRLFEFSREASTAEGLIYSFERGEDPSEKLFEREGRKESG
jgi:hypothetical protein